MKYVELTNTEQCYYETLMKKINSRVKSEVGRIEVIEAVDILIDELLNNKDVR